MGPCLEIPQVPLPACMGRRERGPPWRRAPIRIRSDPARAELKPPLPQVPLSCALSTTSGEGRRLRQGAQLV